MSDKYPNKRLRFRRGGRFRRAEPADLGIAGICPTPGCGGIMTTYYHGDSRAPFLDPAKFKPRCFRCHPLTSEEQAIEDAVAAERKSRQGPGIFETIAENERKHREQKGRAE